MVETGGLENRCTGNRTGGSNPSPSASIFVKGSQNHQKASALLRILCSQNAARSGWKFWKIIRTFN